jgi:hypothetical protein
MTISILVLRVLQYPDYLTTWRGWYPEKILLYLVTTKTPDHTASMMFMASIRNNCGIACVCTDVTESAGGRAERHMYMQEPEICILT